MSPKTDIERVTLRNGYWFYFDDDGLKITVFCSALSGKEVVFIDDNIVSHKYHWGINNIHHVEYNHHCYDVHVTVKSLLKGEVICTLEKNGQLLSIATKCYAQTKALLWKKFCIGFILGLTAGYLVTSSLISLLLE